MSTAIGKRMIDGGAVKYHSTGGGVARNIASSVVGHTGHAIVNKLASAVKGSGWKVAGTGVKRKAHKKAGRPKTHHKKRK